MPAVTPAGPAGSPVTLPQVIREVEEFAAAAGWEQPPQLFALVATAELLSRQPELGDQVDATCDLTPVAQEPLPEDDLAEVLAGIVWPETVSGCAVVQEIVVLPPEAEAELGVTDVDDLDGLDDLDAVRPERPEPDPVRMRRIAAEHPHRREARLVAGVLRDGTAACVLRLRGDAERPDEIVEHPELAPNLITALRDTLRD
ncbi:MAG TPA: PPA1309 family protein [Pseudonocardiaceae bacterium]|nr:PPA1309 family protein [Pseudonocardiaceae bacterium]